MGFAHNIEIASEPHNKDSSLFVKDELRICAGCPDGENIHQLHNFLKMGNEYSCLCRSCVQKDRAISEENVKERAVEAFTDIVTSIKQSRKKTRQSIPVDEIFGTLYDRIGKRHCEEDLKRPAFEMIADVYSVVLEDALKDKAEFKDKELACKIGDTMIKNAIAVEKRNGVMPIEFNDLTEEQQRDLLVEPARQLILSDAKFRKELMKIKDVRIALLGNEGVEVLEATDVQA